MNRSNASIYNGVSILFLVLSLLVIIFVVLQLTSDAPDDSPDFASLPTAVQLPTQTPTLTPTETLTPTLTLTPTNTETPTPTDPPTDTAVPTTTITPTPGPTETPSLTFTPSISPTPIPSETSSVPTPTFTATDSPFAFGLNGEVFIGPNGVNTAGCNWQGVGGSVISLTGQEVTQTFQVRVFGSGIERTVQTGTNSFYGATSGWEVALDNTIGNRMYFVRLETTLGTPLSADIELSFPGDCNANAAIIRFQQLRELNTTAPGNPGNPGGDGSLPPGVNQPPADGGTTPGAPPPPSGPPPGG